MRGLLAVALFTLALNASAEIADACFAKRPGDVPVLPDGTEASYAQMHEAQLEAEKYLLQANAYMDCGVMNRRQHNALAARVAEFSERYSEELIKFQVRARAVAGSAGN
ncbi:MAG: hypothetical protein ACPG1A_10195 [Halioglobus sp.]